jgi:hypothetical protein
MEARRVPLTLEQKIEKLEDEIEGYGVQLNIAIHERNDPREERFSNLINQARVQLHDLNVQLQQLQQARQSK